MSFALNNNFIDRYPVGGAKLAGFPMSRSPLSGVSDSKKFTLGMWFKKEDLDDTDGYLFCGASVSNNPNGPRIYFTTGNKLKIQCLGTGGSDVLDIETSNPIVAGSGWKHLFCSVDMSDPAKRHLYITRTSDLVVNTFTDETLDLTPTLTQFIGSGPSGAFPAHFSFAEFVYWPGQYLDLSSGLQYLIGALGSQWPLKPVPFQASTNLIALLGQPAIMLRTERGQPGSYMAINRGTGGNFSDSGIQEITTSPSD